VRIPYWISSCQFQIKKFKIDPTNFGVESLVRFSKPKLFLANSRLEFFVEPKILYASSKRCFSMECQLFGRSLPKSDGPKIPFGLIVVYSNFPMLTIGFFQFTPIFDVVSFSKEPYQKHFCESSLLFEFPFFSKIPFCSKSSLCSSPFDGSL